MGRLVLRSALWGLAWALLLPMAWMTFVIGLIEGRAICAGPGTAPSCGLELMLLTIVVLPLGTAAGFLVTFLRGRRRGLG